MMDWFVDDNGNPGHGEFVARVAAGQDYGIARSANLVIIKYKQGITDRQGNNLRLSPAKRGALDHAFLYAIDDAIAAFPDGTRKAVINYSAGKFLGLHCHI
jgi:hypothetical protein